MKKTVLLILSFVVILFSGCMGTPNEITNPPEIENEQNEHNEQKFPSVFSFENMEISVEEIIETTQLEFNDGDTKIKLTNSDGKYLVANYMVKNNESFQIDIDHSVEISVIDVSGQVHYGEYYEYKTGKENIKIGPGEEKIVSFVCDFNLEGKPDIITFKYKGKSYDLKAEVE